MWPCSCCKTTTPIMLGQVGMMGDVIWQHLQSHTGCAKLLSPCKSVAQPVALQQQISPMTDSVSSRSPHNSVSSRSPHNSASSTDVLSYSVPITVKDTVLIVLSLLYFVVERYDSVL